jgi:arginyl-tRNA synthetase
MQDAFSKFRQQCAEALEKATGKKVDPGSLSAPPDPKLGDLSSNVAFSEKNPQKFAEKTAKKIKTPGGLIANVKATGPYINFFANREKLSALVLEQAMKTSYGKGKPKKDKVMVEFAQPNTHKAFHIGHLRNISLGESLARVMDYAGYREVVRANYQGDVGAHIAKCLWGLRKFHSLKEAPEKHKGAWLGKIYSDSCKKLAENPEKYEPEVKEVFNKMETGEDLELMKTWEKTRKWSLDEFKEIYKELGTHFDVYFFESEVEKRGKKLVEEMVKKGIAKKDEGAIVVDLGETLGVFILLRSDGTALYSTKDLALAKEKFERYDIDKSVYVVGSEQNLYLKQVFKTLELMGFEQAKKCHHLSYGLVILASGKMKSREGKVITYWDLAEKMKKKATQEVSARREDLPEKEKKDIAESVAIGAMKYGMISRSSVKTITFDWQEALKFEGETGPYIQYAHARACRILEKAKGVKGAPDYSRLENAKEKALLKLLGNFPGTVEETAENMEPHRLANFTYELAKAFSEFYTACPVIQEKSPGLRAARLNLVKASENTLKISLNLLGIDAPERM